MPRPSVICFICGREFGSASISIHIPNCEKKWDLEQSKLPKRQRRPCPTRPEYFDKVVSGELKGAALQEALINYNDQAFEDFNKKALEECKTCGRTFLPRALEVHSRSKCKPRPDPSTNNINGGSGSTRNGYSRLKKNSDSHGQRSNSPTKDLSPKASRHRSKSPTKNSPTKTRSPMQQKAQQNGNGNDDSSINGGPPMIRPGTYKKSDVPMLSSVNGNDGGSNKENGENEVVVPSREDLVAMVEKDIAFSSPKNRIELFNLIRKLTCEEPSEQALK